MRCLALSLLILSGVARAANVGPGAPVCERSEFVKRAIEKHFKKNCQDITLDKLEFILHLQIAARTPFRSGDFLGMHGLRSLKLVYNPSQKTLPADLLAGQYYLDELQLQNMPLTEIPPNFFLGTRNLRWLSLENLPMKELPASALEYTRLESFALDNVPLERVTKELFEQLSSTRRIHFRNTQVTELPKDVFDSLTRSVESLVFSGAKITTFPVETLVNNRYSLYLDVFSIGDNKLSDAEKARVRQAIHGRRARNIEL